MTGTCFDGNQFLGPRFGECKVAVLPLYPCRASGRGSFVNYGFAQFNSSAGAGKPEFRTVRRACDPERDRRRSSAASVARAAPRPAGAPWVEQQAATPKADASSRPTWVRPSFCARRVRRTCDPQSVGESLGPVLPARRASAVLASAPQSLPLRPTGLLRRPGSSPRSVLERAVQVARPTRRQGLRAVDGRRWRRRLVAVRHVVRASIPREPEPVSSAA